MNIVLLTIGKTADKYLIAGLKNYKSRLKHYMPFELIEIPNIKKRHNLSKVEIKKKEEKMFLQYIKSTDYVILLDENGKEFSSIQFSKKLQSWLNNGKKRLLFIVGGSYGFSDDIDIKFSEKISLSRMTFSHQMVRLFFTEQLYRAFSIIKNESYHHE